MKCFCQRAEICEQCVAMEPTILDFNPKKYKFRERACEALGVTCIDCIHGVEKIKTLNKSHTTNQLSRHFSEREESCQSFILDLLGDTVSVISFCQSPPFSFSLLRQQKQCNSSRQRFRSRRWEDEFLGPTDKRLGRE